MAIANTKKTTQKELSMLSDTTSKNDVTINKYIKSISIMSKSTANEYWKRLSNFQMFIGNEYRISSTDDLIVEIRKGILDVYDILNGYSAYLQQNYTVSALTLKLRVVTVKNFFEYYDVDISPRKFKLKVKLPRIIKRSKEALSKEDVIGILNACSDIKLKTYVMLLAATGMRATEALSIRIRDLDLTSNPAKVFVRGEYTKTKTDRTVFLTEEISQQLTSWLNYKYRTRRVCYKDEQTGKIITEHRTPDREESDLVFAVYQSKGAPDPQNLYYDIAKFFGKTLDSMGKGSREDGNNERRREITLHSFRRFVKTTISDLGYSDYSEWFIGHSGSTYWTKKDSEKAEIFSKVEPYLTFLNIPELQRQVADIQTKVEELEDLNQSLRNRDKMKDDAIAQLSDQLMALTARMQEFERKQQPYVS
ncbi:MAG: tyrosine-type recombinase/integrase [Nitrososphaeraceae archaeon]